MRMKPFSLALVLVAVGLAGCAGAADDGPVIDYENLDNNELAEGKGAIAGVLFDDRYRPIQLMAEGEAQSEFQAEGFILVQETGQQILTNENGEFAILDLEPGRYTLRTSASGHAASPLKVQVEEGLWSEESILARRALIDDGMIQVEEYMIFIPCTVGYFIQSLISGCGTDQSGDNNRFAVPRDYTAETNVTFLVAEVTAKEESSYTLQIRDEPGEIRWGVQDFEGTYAKIVLERGVLNTESDDQGRNIPWNNDQLTEFLLFPGAPREKEISDATAPGCNAAVDEQLETVDDAAPDEEFPGSYAPVPRTCGGYQGVGVGLAYEARLLMSLFIGEPAVDVQSYCVICQ